MSYSVGTLGLCAALLGIASHQTYFIRGEHHNSSVPFFLTIVFGPPTAILYLSLVRGHSYYQALLLVSTVFLSFTGSLTGSILIYRFFFHRLGKYPGPATARLSQFWRAQRTFSKYNTFRLLDELHAKHGDYVRTGPNELSVIDPEIVEALYGPQSKCIKGPWYDISLPITSLHQLRDRALHDKRRRGGWDKAFNTKSLRAYDPRVIQFADLLLEKLDSFSGKPVDATRWFSFFSYDVMGSLGFARSFDTLKTGGSHNYLEVVRKGFKIVKFGSGVPWLVHIFTKVPAAINPIRKLLVYSDECVQERRKNTAAEPDILGHLIEFEKFYGDASLDHGLLMGDSRLVIVAGSDTTAAALTYTFYYIAKDPLIAEKIRAELKENNIDMGEDFSIPSLQNLPYLNGVMQEGLRLHPPVPAGVFRTTPSEGLQVGDHVIPGGVNVLVPTYSLQRSPKNFARPNEFIPERWSSEPDLVINKNAFTAFSAGPYGCIGKHLAMGELRTVISKIVTEFDVHLAPGEAGRSLIEKELDVFTLAPGKLELCFVRRNETLN